MNPLDGPSLIVHCGGPKPDPKGPGGRRRSLRRADEGPGHGSGAIAAAALRGAERSTARLRSGAAGRDEVLALRGERACATGVL